MTPTAVRPLDTAGFLELRTRELLNDILTDKNICHVTGISITLKPFLMILMQVSNKSASSVFKSELDIDFPIHALIE